MSEQIGNPEEPHEGASSVDYEAMYRETHPDLIDDKDKAAVVAHAEKPKTDEAMILHTKEAIFDRVLMKQPEGIDLDKTRQVAEIAKTDAAYLLDAARADGEAAGLGYDLGHHDGLRVEDADKARAMAEAAKPQMDDALHQERQAQVGPADDAEANRSFALRARGYAERAADRAGNAYDQSEGQRITDPDKARDMAEASKRPEEAIVKNTAVAAAAEAQGETLKARTLRYQTELARDSADYKQSQAEQTHDLQEDLARDITDTPEA